MSSGKALVIHPVLPLADKGRRFALSLEEKTAEAQGLARAINLEVLDTLTPRVTKPTPGYLIGKGAREEIGFHVAQLKPDVVIVNHNLSPIQQRNLEKEWKAKVIDRTGLILEIFGARAQTKEGKIQVELAALQYQRSRLVRMWTHLERQRGGLGKVGGPGEKQIELDRRRLDEKLLRLKADLERVRGNRELQRKSRERVPFPIVALVGYTNAGKSTLFNRLTGAEVFAEDLLFATLDPTMRNVKLSNGQNVILSDTVGFIADLPTHLVEAFRATLEQTKFADVILHVRDMAQSGCEAQKEDVIAILKDLGIEYETDARIIEVMNKIDTLPPEQREDIMRQAHYGVRSVAVSALTGLGTGELLSLIQTMVSANRQVLSYKIAFSDGEALAWLYENCSVVERQDGEENIAVSVDMDPANVGRFKERFSYEPQPQRSKRRKSR